MIATNIDLIYRDEYYCEWSRKYHPVSRYFSIFREKSPNELRGISKMTTNCL